MSAAISLAEKVGVATACRALRLPRSALYRDRAARHVCLLPSGRRLNQAPTTGAVAA